MEKKLKKNNGRDEIHMKIIHPKKYAALNVSIYVML